MNSTSSKNHDTPHQVTLLQSASKLLEFTSHSGKFVAGLDLVYLSRCVENYLPFLATDPRYDTIQYDTIK